MRLAKDQGAAWLVMVASALSHMFSIGISLGTLGSLTAQQIDHFKVTLTASSWVGSAHVGLSFLMCPVASFVLKKISPRWVQVMGGITSTIGFSCCYFATQIWHMYILMGLIAGWGIACLYMASSEILAYHFERHIYLTSSVAILGYHLGLSFIPSASQFLFSTFGFNLTMLIIGCSQLTHVIAAIFYFPGSKEGESMSKEGAVNLACETDVDISPCEFKISENTSKISELDEDQEDQTINSANQQRVEKSVVQIVVSLLKNKRVICYMVCGFLFSGGVNGYLSIAVKYMEEEVGMDVKDAVLGQTIIGLAGNAGVILICATSQLKYDRVITLFATTLTYGLMALISAFSTGKMMYFILMGIYGVAFGAHIANLLGVAYCICGPEEMVVLFGLELLAEGVGALIGAPSFSRLGAVTNRKWGIIASGVVQITAGAVLIPAIFISCKDRNRTRRDTPEIRLNRTMNQRSKIMM